MNTVKKDLEQLNDAEKQVLNIPDVMHSYSSRADKSRKKKLKWQKKRRKNSWL
jgi:hypothetical protein